MEEITGATLRRVAPERMAGKTGRLVSFYKLSASVTDPVMSPHMDGTIFRTLCVDLDRHLSNVNVHVKAKAERKGRTLKLAHPLEYKKSIGPLGKMLLMYIHRPISRPFSFAFCCKFR